MQIILILKSILIFSFILGLIVLLHELGHYIAARLTGCKVEAFAFGFGPSILKKKKGDTDYRWNLIPLGGYCQIMGESRDVNDPSSLSSKNPVQKLFVFSAGVLMNIVLAIFAYTLYLSFTNFQTYIPQLPDIQTNFVGVQEEIVNKPLITDILADTPALESGMQPEEFLWAVDAIEIRSIDQFKDYLQDKFGQTVTLKTLSPYEQGYKEYKLYLDYKDEEGKVLAGFGNNPSTGFYILNYSQNKVFSGFAHTLNISKYTIGSIRYLISESKAQDSLEPISQGTGTILKAGEITYKYVKGDKFLEIVNLLAGISLSVGILNILPIPPLDGGHILVLFVEIITRRKMPDKWKSIIFNLFFALLMLLFVVMLIKDVKTSDIGIVKSTLEKLHLK
ncbi:site-2 protease family protein [bacterium]|nr:MAG: site-2 protease family protein [bacterium]